VNLSNGEVMMPSSDKKTLQKHPRPTALFRRACVLLGVSPGKIRLVGPTEWEAITGQRVGSHLGRASSEHEVVYVRRTATYDTYLHELLHVLFPARPHWWIFGAAFKLAGVKIAERHYGRLQTAENIKESRWRLIELAKAAAIRRGLGPD
jgi:hypothetical protein